MTRRLSLLMVVLAGLAWAGSSLADGIPPVRIQIIEREPGAFEVSWRVPPQVPAAAVPFPVLPADCELVEESVPTRDSGGLTHRRLYRSSGSLAGRTVGVSYPVLVPGLTALIRVELLTGERHVHALGALETAWRIPAPPPDTLTTFSRAARTGIRHFLVGPAHLVLLLAILLLGGQVRLVTAFTAGQLAGWLAADLTGVAVSADAAEVALAVGAMFLAREAARVPDDRRRTVGLATLAGIFHGTALPAAAGWLPLAAVVGMDAVLILAVLLLARPVAGLAGRFPAFARRGHLVAGGGAVAVALLVALSAGPQHGPAAAGAGLPPLAGSSGRRIAPVAPAQVDAPVRSFLAVEPFEVRHEVLVRVRDFAADLALGDAVPVAMQPAVLDRLTDLVAARARVTVDGRPAPELLRRAAFVTSDPTGVLPRTEPVPEPLSGALVGVTIIHAVDTMPQAVTVAWSGFEDTGDVPAAIVDPETSLTGTLTADAPELAWENRLLSDPTPLVADVTVDPAELPVPLASVALVLAALVLLAGGRGRARDAALPRILLAAAFLTVGTARVGVALPDRWRPAVDERQARRVVAGLLPNVYRSFEVRDEDRVHDRLALTVAQEALADIYLDQRRSLVVQDRGGARARVETVEILTLDGLAPAPDGGFTARVAWTVGGTVTHFGHRHFRQNRYDARLEVAPEDGRWKLRALEVLELERLR